MVPPDALILIALIFGVPLMAIFFLVSFSGWTVAKRCGLIRPEARSFLQKKWLLGSSATVLFLYAAMFSYGTFIETQWVECTRTVIPVREPVLGHERFRIVHLSDLHIKRMGRLERRVIEIVREANPHLIVITGDFASSGGTAAAVAEMLGPLEAPYGKYGVTGNNDLENIVSDLPRMAGMELLRDDMKLIQDGPERLCLAGQNVHPGIPLKEILRKQPKGAYTIFLHHKPDAVDELRALEPGQQVDLFLCGHTHGGQVCLPFWGAVVTQSKYHKKYERGSYDINGAPMYVNRGIGAETLPVRFLSRPEVAVIDLVCPKEGKNSPSH